MSGCLDSINISRPEWLDLGEKRNAVSSIIAGVLFFVGWWVIIDIAAYYPSESFYGAYHVCGICGTFSLFMINAVSNGQVRGDSYTNGFLGQKAARLWLFVGFVLGFSSIIAATWILFAEYVLADKAVIYPGVGLFIQNFLILMGSLIFKFGRTESESQVWDY